MGLQGKLLLMVFALLSASLGTSCWLFVSQSQKRLGDMMGEQARQLATALALASADELRNHELAELRAMSQDLIKGRNILFVAFMNAQGTPIVVASRDLDFNQHDLRFPQHQAQALMQVNQLQSPLFGSYLQVTAPVLSIGSDGEGPEGPRLQGYVAVGLSQAREEVQLTRITYMALIIGCAILTMALPLAFVLVRRIFYPIRQLVDATRRIAGGDLDAQVAVHRPDAIGDLARSFNEMAQRIKQQQRALEQANEQLEEINHDLEQKVEQRTAQLEMANQRLSSEIAEKEDFLRAVSHDLNAPLRNISGMATMLLMKHREKFDEDVIHRLERIQKNVEVETDLIGELLELSRIKTRRQKMEPVEIDALVRELSDVFENDLKSRQIELILDSPLPVLTGERARLRQVFQNLIDNAIKYMGSGPCKEIHIGCTIRLTEAEFYVRDTGMGIDPEDLDKVFFVFRRGKNSTTQQIAGKGIGLASVKSIIETYSGKIWVESQPGEGSTFRFTINGKHVPASSQLSSPRRIDLPSHRNAQECEPVGRSAQ